MLTSSRQSTRKQQRTLSSLLTFETGLRPNAVECAGRQVIGWVTGNSHLPSFRRVPELLMTPFHAIQVPTVLPQPFDHVPHFHERLADKLNGGIR